MVGSGGGTAAERNKEAMGMMALHEALRSVCLNSDWTYSVFWTIRPRPRVRGGNGGKVGDDNGSLMLMWEDGFCRGRIGESLNEIDSEDPVRKAFSKLSIQLYNYGEGLMGKVASDKCHKWVFKEPTECEPNVSNYWQSSFDSLPPEWADQFESGIQTIAVIQVGHGLLQLGSCKTVPEDLYFVLRMRHAFESLGYQSGLYLSHFFSSNKNAVSSISFPSKQPIPVSTRPPLLKWGQRTVTSPLPSLNTQCPVGTSNGKHETHVFSVSHLSEAEVGELMPQHDATIKWPTGLTFFSALNGSSEETRLFNHEQRMETNPEKSPNPLLLEGNPSSQSADHFLSLESIRKMDSKFERSFTLPARMTSSSSSTSLDQHLQHTGEYKNHTPYFDVMETFLE